MYTFLSFRMDDVRGTKVVALLLNQAAHWFPKNCLDSELISLFLSVVCTDNVKQ